MARVEILRALKDTILKQFKAEAKTIFKLMHALEENPHKGKVLGQVGGIGIKEVRYRSFRFYCITDGQTVTSSPP